jgi:hypothetical protein
LLWLSACGGNDPLDAVAATLPDPGSARFQAVSDRGGHVCGHINGKAAGAGYTGYRRFVHDKGSRVTRLDPQEALAPAHPSVAGCAKPVSYQSVNERLSCAAAPAEEAAARLQSEFEVLWQRNCS